MIPFGYKAFVPSGKAWHTNYLPKTHGGDGAYCNSKALQPAAEADQQASAGITPSADGFLWNADGNHCPAEGNCWFGPLVDLIDGRNGQGKQLSYDDRNTGKNVLIKSTFSGFAYTVCTANAVDLLQRSTLDYHLLFSIQRHIQALIRDTPNNGKKATSHTLSDRSLKKNLN